MTAFGRASRDASSKLYLSPEHDKASSGSSPGPTTAAQLPAFRRQQLSNKINAPSVGFARSARQTYPLRPGPGPGECLCQNGCFMTFGYLGIKNSVSLTQLLYLAARQHLFDIFMCCEQGSTMPDPEVGTE